MNDLNLFGFMFESLVTRDLRIYIEHLNGNIYHFYDNNTEEVNAIVELRDEKLWSICNSNHCSKTTKKWAKSNNWQKLPFM